MSEHVDYLKREIGHKDAEIVRLETIIATLKAGLDAIARTEHHEQSMAQYMQYEARLTLRIASEGDAAEKDKVTTDEIWALVEAGTGWFDHDRAISVARNLHTRGYKIVKAEADETGAAFTVINSLVRDRDQKAFDAAMRAKREADEADVRARERVVEQNDEWGR
jgi:hypothetical protein